MRNPFRYFKTSPEIIRLTVMMYVRLRTFRHTRRVDAVDCIHGWNAKFLRQATVCGGSVCVPSNHYLRWICIAAKFE